jgi:histidinol-phosphate phosphatase family protein
MTTAIILAGGRGTRSANPDIAKACVTVGDRPLLQHHFDLLQKSQIHHSIIVAGHAASQVVDTLKYVNTYGIQTEVIIEDSPRGTVRAVRYATDKIKVESHHRFLVILADILASFRVRDFLHRWEKSGKPLAVVTHPSNHPNDSDLVFENYDGSVVTRPKKSDLGPVPNMCSAGIFAFMGKALKDYQEIQDIGADVIPSAAMKSELFVFNSSHYFKDTGTASRLISARHDFASGVFARRGSLKQRAAVFLDRDGVLNPETTEVVSANNYRLCEGVAPAIARVNASGIPIFVVTNQPGIAKGFISESEHQLTRARMDFLLAEQGAFVDDYVYCPHHPLKGFDGEVPELKKVCGCRKPEIGMITKLQQHHCLSVEGSIMVGDTWRDRELSQRTGLRFIHVSSEPRLTEDHIKVADPAEAISLALELASC